MSAMHELKALARARPEWSPWLAVVEVALRAVEHPAWKAAALDSAKPPADGAPLLAGATLHVDEGELRSLYAELISVARRGGVPSFAALDPAHSGESHAVPLVRAVLNADDDGVGALADEAHVAAAAYRALGELLPLPALLAVRRASRIPQGWTRGYCPVCGRWPAFTEMRGVERARHLRCGGCGAEWAASCLACAYCGETDHEALAALLPEARGGNGSLEVCRQCQGYMKVRACLRGALPECVMLDDLASVELDIAAVERGYRRPAGRGYALGITLRDRRGAAS